MQGPSGCCVWNYRASHRFWQDKFPDGGSVLGSSQFSILPQLPLKTMLGLKVVKIDSKISSSLHWSESVTYSVGVGNNSNRNKTVQLRLADLKSLL